MFAFVCVGEVFVTDKDFMGTYLWVGRSRAGVWGAAHDMLWLHSWYSHQPFYILLSPQSCLNSSVCYCVPCCLFPRIVSPGSIRSCMQLPLSTVRFSGSFFSRTDLFANVCSCFSSYRRFGISNRPVPRPSWSVAFPGPQPV